jgi:uncharacterized protein YrrD
MRKGTDIVGRSIVAFNTGKRIGRVEDLIFDQDTNQLLGFLVQDRGVFHEAKVIPLSAVRSIGSNAIVVPERKSIVSSGTIPQIEKVLQRNLVLKGTHILTVNGRSLGSIVDLYFDEQTGRIEGYEASGGLFADAYSGRSFIPAPHTIRIGEEVTFVPPETATLMEEQVGGIRGAMETAGARIQESAEVANQKLQETAQTANEKLQQAAMSANGSLQQGSQGAVAALTNRVVTPEEQYIYVVGKTVEHDVSTSDGQVLALKDQVVTQSLAKAAHQQGVLDQLYRATGGKITEPVGQKLKGLAEGAKSSVSGMLARVTVDQAKGRRVQQMVRDNNGFIIAAPGQIVTDTVIDRAKAHRQEAALLNAVGLQPSEAVKSNTSGTLTDTKYRLREGAAIAQENASTFWNDLKAEFRHLKSKSMRAIHASRIEQALGRPVTRVILDPQDNVILNMGELITHRAIWQAEQAGVLNILLNSVYVVRRPEILTSELRASEPGMAALESGK